MSDPVLDYLQARRLELGPCRERGAGAHGNWRSARDGNGVAWLVIDCAGASANTLGAAVLEELRKELERLAADPPAGLVIRSAKPGGFVAGADVREFRGLHEAETVASRLRDAHQVVDRLEALGFPTLAVIHGHCLGGGLELALACRHRLAIRGATFGFPEVRLGLHPGLGGTARATALIDPLEAMSLMLTGRSVGAGKARALGLVDVLTEERHVLAAVAAALAGRIERPRRGPRAAALSSAAGRAFTASRLRARTAAKVREAHYPAPFALVDLWRRHGGEAEAMKRAEVDSFARLLVGPTARNLVRAFLLREKLKHSAPGRHRPRRVHVVGAGAMGGDIATWCALQGLQVSLADRDPSSVASAIGRAAALFDARLDTGAARRDALDRLVPDVQGAGVARADLVIEAVPEKLEIKRQVYAELEPRMRDGAVLASNTSSIPLEALGETLADPGRLVGVHFFNPVHRMQLVEVVRHPRADPLALEKAADFVVAIDRLPVEVSSAPGFLVNRALIPYLLEAMVMLEEGVAPETLDAAAEGFGMPVGPVELIDRVGLDICLHVGEVLRGALDRPLPAVPGRVAERVRAGDLGAKTGRGLYRYRDGRAVKSARFAPPEPAMTERLILPMVDACVGCLREGVCDDADSVDAAMIFATGFAPFRGGPLAYARSRGVDAVTAALEGLAARHGERFSPDPGWSRLE